MLVIHVYAKMKTEYNRDDHVWIDYENAVGREKVKGAN